MRADSIEDDARRTVTRAAASPGSRTWIEPTGAPKRRSASRTTRVRSTSGAARPDRIRRVSRTVFDLFEEEDGLDALFGLIREALPERLYETAYALACDVVTADGRHSQVELRMLEEVREELKIDLVVRAVIRQYRS